VTRTDYYDDPAAPRPNSLVPAASVIVVNQQGEILLQHRRDNHLWALPGGTMQLGETIRYTAVREVKEETGLDIDIVGLVGVYSDPRHVIAYSDGEVRQQFNLCFIGRLAGGAVAIGPESHAVEFVPERMIDQLPMHPTTRLRISHYLAGHNLPFLG